MTLYEYEARMYAFNLEVIDKENDMHKQAWLNHQVTGMKQKGKDKQEPVYKKFKEFFDYDKAIKEVEKDEKSVKEITSKQRKLAELQMKANLSSEERRKNDGNS